jgi:hypothetical protein
MDQRKGIELSSTLSQLNAPSDEVHIHRLLKEAVVGDLMLDPLYLPRSCPNRPCKLELYVDKDCSNQKLKSIAKQTDLETMSNPYSIIHLLK